MTLRSRRELAPARETSARAIARTCGRRGRWEGDAPPRS